jgi:lipopolysaccharide/colanic/teichoic acid biosynthesis glycosyltransferase
MLAMRSLLDGALCVTAAMIAFLLRDNFEITPRAPAVYTTFLGSCFLFGTLWSRALSADRGIFRMSSSVDYMRVIHLAALTTACSVVAVFVSTRGEGIPRSLPLLQLLVTIAVLAAPRFLLSWRHQRRGHRQQLTSRSRRVLIVGMGRETEVYLSAFSQLAERDIEIVGILSQSEHHRNSEVRGIRILGLLDELLTVVRDLRVHGVEATGLVVTRSEALSTEVKEQISALQDSGMSVVYWTDVFGGILTPSAPAKSGDTNEVSTDARETATSPLQVGPVQVGYRFKRAFDLIGAAILLTFLSPIMLIVGSVMVFDTGRLPIFWQRRPGRNGIDFHVYKFQTMGYAYDQDGNRLADAARTSAIGHFIRDKRLDELPQLFNVLLGSMSFVGPRPLLPHDQPLNSNRLAVRPGITGWAQINGGREICSNVKGKLDDWYVENMSFRIDVMILARTVGVTVFGERMTQMKQNPKARES